MRNSLGALGSLVRQHHDVHRNAARPAAPLLHHLLDRYARLAERPGQSREHAGSVVHLET
jgi:hypothetical protein